MFPGYVTKISEAAYALTTTLIPKTDLVRITDTTSTTVITTIRPPAGGEGSVMFVQNGSGANITTVTTGNVLTAVTIGDKALVLFVFSKALGKYIVGALA